MKRENGTNAYYFFSFCYFIIEISVDSFKSISLYTSMVSEFEKKRLENIARNEALLQQFNIPSLPTPPPTTAKAKTSRAKKTDPSFKVAKSAASGPIRRSSRLAGVKLEKVDMIDVDDRELFRNSKAGGSNVKQEEDFKERIIMDQFKLSDLVSDDQLKSLGDKFSAGDLFDQMKDQVKVPKSVEQVREDLTKLEMYSLFPPNKVQVTPERMTTIEFHPNLRQVVLAGDKLGNLGIWTPEDDTEDDAEPHITRLALHTKNIPRIRFIENQVVTCSYDGSIRKLDLSKDQSDIILKFEDEYGQLTGVSDLHFVDSNIGILTTLDGEGMRFDMRDPDTLKRHAAGTWRLHDKKIGYSALCPANPNLLSTGSLDRSMRIWDLRMASQNDWSKFGGKSVNCIASYDSRLSVSSCDWNTSGDLVINGYDDTIRLFNFGQNNERLPNYDSGYEGFDEIVSNLTPDKTITHNCQTGRWVTILKARWQASAQDNQQKFVIGNMKKALDIYGQDGTMLGHITDELMTSVPSACVFHPTQNWVVGGNNSGKTFLFTK